jgi:hypothetical protein
MRIRKENELATGTHSLESAERRTGEDTEIKRTSERNSLAGVAQIDGQVRIRRKGEQAEGIHRLESAGRRRGEYEERKRAGGGHLPTGERTATYG